jgi:hypothetical protein
MDPKFDIAKLVGAASAPVALIIAASIFQSNLGAKYSMIATLFRQVSGELRTAEDKESLHTRSMHEQLSVYARRLTVLMNATFWLALAILCFILTVVFTGLSLLFPQFSLFPVITALFSFAGALILALGVVLEMLENHMARRALVLETAEFPGVLPGEQESQKDQLRQDHEQYRANR